MNLMLPMLQSSTPKARQAGFTLIELILYIAIVTIFLSGAVLFAWDVVYGSVKATVQQEVNQTMQLVTKRLLYDVRNSNGILSIQPTDLCLASPDASYNPTRYYLQDGRIRVAWGGGSTDCTGMIQDQPLTSNLVTVTNFNLIDVSSANNQHVRFQLAIEYTNPSGRTEWEYSQAFSGSAEVRFYE